MCQVDGPDSLEVLGLDVAACEVKVCFAGICRSRKKGPSRIKPLEEGSSDRGWDRR